MCVQDTARNFLCGSVADKKKYEIFMKVCVFVTQWLCSKGSQSASVNAAVASCIQITYTRDASFGRRFSCAQTSMLSAVVCSLQPPTPCSCSC